MSFPVPLLSRCAFCIYLEILTRIPIIDELIPKFSARHTLLTVIFASDSQPPDVTHTSTPGLVRGGHGGAAVRAAKLPQLTASTGTPRPHRMTTPSARALEGGRSLQRYNNYSTRLRGRNVGHCLNSTKMTISSWR